MKQYLRPVFGGGEAGVFFEDFVEVAGVFVAYQGGDFGGGDVGVSQGAFGGLHADLGEVVYGGEAFFFLENSGEVSGVEVEVFGEHFHGNGFAVVFLEEVFCLFGDGLASFGGFGAAGEGYFFFYEGEDFFSVFVGGPEAVVGKVVPAFFGRGVVKADQEFVYVLDQVFEIVDQGVEAVYEGAELFCGILGAFAAELIFKVLPVQAAGELAGVGGGVFHVIYFAVPGQKTVLQGLFALVEEFGGEGTGNGTQPEGDYGAQDIEFHDLGIQGFVYLLLERLQGGRGKKKDSVGGIGARQEAEGGGEPGGEAVGQYAVYVFYAEIAALVVAAHMGGSHDEFPVFVRSE